MFLSQLRKSAEFKQRELYEIERQIREEEARMVMERYESFVTKQRQPCTLTASEVDYDNSTLYHFQAIRVLDTKTQARAGIGYFYCTKREARLAMSALKVEMALLNVEGIPCVDSSLYACIGTSERFTWYSYGPKNATNQMVRAFKKHVSGHIVVVDRHSEWQAVEIDFNCMSYNHFPQNFWEYPLKTHCIPCNDYFENGHSKCPMCEKCTSKGVHWIEDGEHRLQAGIIYKEGRYACEN